MAVKYRVYRNAGDGGPVDYATPHADALASPAFAEAVTEGDWRYAVRAYDDGSGVEEPTADAVARVVIVGLVDVTARPDPPTLPSAVPLPGGLLAVRWCHRKGAGGPPTGYRVWLAAGSTVDYGLTPAAVVPHTPGATAHAATLAGLAVGPYAVAIRAYNAVAEEPNTSAAVTLAYPAAPSAPQSLVAAAASIA